MSMRKIWLYFSSVFIVIMFLFHSLALYVSILINSHCAQNIDIVSILLRLRRWEAIKRSYGLKYNCRKSNSKGQNHWYNRHCLLGLAITSLKLKWSGRGNSKDMLGRDAVGRRQGFLVVLWGCDVNRKKVVVCVYVYVCM